MMFLNIFSFDKALPEYRKKIFAFSFISILVLLIYSNSFNGSWHFDDEFNILTRKAIHLSELTWPNINKTFYNDSGKLYRPVACFSLALNYYFAKDNPRNYHIVNTIIHLITSVFLFLCIYQILSLPVLKFEYQYTRYSIALLSTLLWATNPIHTQAVSYIVQRMTSLCGLFYIMSLYYYLKANMTSKRKIKIIFFTCFIISGILAIGSKQNAFMLPLSVYLMNHIFFPHTSKTIFKLRFIVWVAALMILLSIGLFFFTDTENIRGLLKGYELRSFTLTERMLSEPRILLFYLSLIFYPMPNRLSIQHDFILSKSILPPSMTIIAILIIIAIVILAFYFSKKHPLLSFSLLFFLCNHIMESSILPLELIFEHRNYIPSMFLFVPISAYLIYGVTKTSLKDPLKYLIVFLVPCFIFVFGHGTLIRNKVWRSELTLWTDASIKAPNSWRSWHNLAKAYQDLDPLQALKYYSKALQYIPSSYKDDLKLTYYNIGQLFQDHFKNNTKALFYYLESEKIDPDYPPMLNNLGVVYWQTGQIDQAIQKLNKSIQLYPELYQPYLNLGDIFLRIKNEPDMAIKFLEQSLILKPQHIPTMQLLGVAYRKKGFLNQAVTYHQMVLKLEPKNLSSLLYLADIYQAKNDPVKTEAFMNRLLNIMSEPDLNQLIAAITQDHTDTILIDRRTAALLIYNALTKNASSFLRKAKKLEKIVNLQVSN